MKEVMILLLPVMLSTWVQPLNFLINTKFGSGFYNGSGVSAMDYANNLYTMIIAIFVLSIMNVVFPKLSKLINDDKLEEAHKLTGETLGVSLIFVIPMMLGVMLLSKEIITLIFGGKEFGEFSIRITSYSLFYFALGMIGYTLQNVLSRVYFAERKVKVPMIGAIAAIITNIALCIPLAKKMDIGGLALASSIAVFVNGVVLIVPLLKKESKVFDKVFFIDILKILISAFAMGIFLYYIKPFILNVAIFGVMGQILKLLIMVILSIIVYTILVVALKVKHIKHFFDILRTKKRGKNEV